MEDPSFRVPKGDAPGIHKHGTRRDWKWGALADFSVCSGVALARNMLPGGSWSMIPKSMPSGFDPMGRNRFSEKIMPSGNPDHDPVRFGRII
jgi:hypothetical protein